MCVVLSRNMNGLVHRGIFRIYYPFSTWFAFSMTISFFFCVVENAVFCGFIFIYPMGCCFLYIIHGQVDKPCDGFHLDKFMFVYT